MKQKLLKILKYTFAFIIILIGISLLGSGTFEYNKYDMICASVSCFICGYILTPLMDKKIKKYNIKKSLFIKTTLFILNLILFILSALYSDIIDNILYPLLNIFINTIFLCIILTISKKNNTSKINKVIIKDNIKEGTTFSLTLITVLSLIDLIEYKNEINFIAIPLLIYILLFISPFFDFVCKKLNKPFNKMQKSLLFFIPIIVLEVTINIGLYLIIKSNLETKILKYFLYFYIAFFIIFFIFFFRKNNKQSNKIKNHKVNNLFISITLFTISTLFFAKLILVNYANLVLKNIDTTPEKTLKSLINNTSLNIKAINTIDKEQENYNLDIIKIYSNMNNYYITHKSNNTVILKYDEKIISIREEKNQNIDYEFNTSKFLESYLSEEYFLQKNRIYNEYDFYRYLVKNKKYKVNILDNLNTILILPSLISKPDSIEFIKINNYDGLIVKPNDIYYLVDLFDRENNYSYQIIMANYSKKEIYDFLSKIEITPESNSNLIEDKIETDFNKINFNSTNDNNKYKCLDGYKNEDNNKCKNGNFTNGIFNINADYKTSIYHNDKYYIVYYKGNLYENSIVNIIDNSGNILKEMNIKESLCNNGNCQYYGLRENNGILYYIDDNDTIKTFDLENIIIDSSLNEEE